MTRKLLGCVVVVASVVAAGAAQPAAQPAPLPPAAPALPADWQDAGFDRHVDLQLLRRAWTEFDPALMAACGLRLAEGERAVGRPHKAFAADKLLALAARMAAERGDRRTLDQLAPAAEAPDAVELRAALKAAAGVSAGETPRVSVDELTPEGFQALKSGLAAVRRAKVSRDAAALARIEKALPQVTALGARGQQVMAAELQSARATLPRPTVPPRGTNAPLPTVIARDTTTTRLNAGVQCTPSNPFGCN